MSQNVCSNCSRTYDTEDALVVKENQKTPIIITSMNLADHVYDRLCKDCLRIAIKSALEARGDSGKFEFLN